MGSYDAVTAAMAQFQAAFTTSTAVPASWRQAVGTEIVADVDAWQDLCCPGMGIVLFGEASLEADAVFMAGPTLCTRQLITMAVLRCAPTIDDHLRAPTDVEATAYMQRVMDDRDRLFTAVWGLSVALGETVGDVSDPVWSPIDAEGGCGGSLIQATFSVISGCP